MRPRMAFAYQANQAGDYHPDRFLLDPGGRPGMRAAGLLNWLLSQNRPASSMIENACRAWPSRTYTYLYWSIALVVALIYGRCLFFGFISGDDYVNVVDNQVLLRSGLGEAIRFFWSKPYQGLYIPVTYTY